jgi:hypothetical protein
VLDKDTLEELATLAKRVDREFYKLNNALEEYEVEFDMDAVVDEVLDNLELDGREISCSSTPDAPDVDIDVDREPLESAIGQLVNTIQELAEQPSEQTDVDPYQVMHMAGFTRDHAIALARAVEVLFTLDVTMEAVTGNGVKLLAVAGTRDTLADSKRILSNLAERLPAPVTAEESMA